MRLIDADAVLKKAMPVFGIYDDSCDFNAVAVGYIKGSPTVDAAIVVHGKWEGNDCGECGAPENKYLKGKPCANFCWNCGADMRGEK